ncbi:hypothetical protein AB3Y40_08355 [Yoonia sp. R2331]
MNKNRTIASQRPAMSRKTVNAICATHPGATLDHNLGEGHDS